MIPEGEVGCKICDKSIYRLFVEHIEQHLNENPTKKFEFDSKEYKELLPHDLQTQLKCSTIEGIWIGNKFYNLGIGSRFSVVVRKE